MAGSEGFVALLAQQHQLRRQEENQNDNSRGGVEEEEDDDDDDDDDELEEEEKGERGISELQRLNESRLVELPSAQAEELEVPPLETVEFAPISSEENDHCNGLLGNSSSGTQLEAEFFQRLFVASDQKVSTSVMAHGAQVQTKNQLHAHVCQTSLSELSSTSVTPSISSASSPMLPEHMPLKADNASMLGADQQTCSDPNMLTVVTPLKTHIPDEYNWRKYGQKQVKSLKGSRSYYKCTNSNCCAKKIEFSDHSGHVADIVNKGIHSHDPPRKNNSGKEGRNVPSAGPCLGKNVPRKNNSSSEDRNVSCAGPCLGKNASETSIKMLKNSGPATLSKEPPPSIIPDQKRHNLVASDGKRAIDIKEKHISEPEPKQRAKKRSLAACADTVMKSGKKQKLVVHTVGDVGISGDGYRWRKYGQKMVKGNPHPRNYYRCTSAGCPARKHIETAVDSTSATIITYKGGHDHDMPVPKKRHGPPSALLVAAAASAALSNLQLKKTDTSQNRVTPSQWSVSKEVESTGQTLDVGGDKEKAVESARTLLSIGFEIKPC